MRFHRLAAVSRMLGGSPCPATLRRWAKAGKIRAAMTSGDDGVFLVSDDEVNALQARLRGAKN